MHRTTIILILSLIAVGKIYAQFDRGTVEISFSGTYGSQVATLSGKGVPGHSDIRSYGFLNTSIGYYLFDGLSLEPQYGLLAMKNIPPSHSLILSLSYSSRFGESPLAFFVHGGYGKGNSLSFPLFGEIPFIQRNKWDVGIINAGAGLKYIVGQVVAFRIELNYRREYFSDTYFLNLPYYTYSSPGDYSYTYTNALIGISVLLH